MPSRNLPPRILSDVDYKRLASFRYALRNFLHFSESAAAEVGLTGQQYQALLVVRSRAERVPVSINDLAHELLIRHNSAVGLADRLVTHGLILRERDPEDRRKVQLRLTPKGERVLDRLATIHRTELRRIGPDINEILGRHV